MFMKHLEIEFDQKYSRLMVDTKTTYVLVFSRHNLLLLYEATFYPAFQKICLVITSQKFLRSANCKLQLGNLTSLNIKIGLLC